MKEEVEPMVSKVNVEEKFSRFGEHWKPKIIGEVNDAYVKAVKVKGEFVWHDHPDEDELFFVVKGRLDIRLPDGEISLGPGEFAIIPHGVEHMPVAEEEAHVLLLEPKSTVNTGTVSNERTVAEPERI
jgi:mannose-6-phosphate isomerase-like protein (cupin superfamily)